MAIDIGASPSSAPTQAQWNDAGQGIRNALISAYVGSAGGLSSSLGAPLAHVGAAREHPTLMKLDNNPAIEFADQTATSVLWPYLVDLEAENLDRIGMVWSTDHASLPNSGIWLATISKADFFAGTNNWTQHGRIFLDLTDAGYQHETPSVLWDEVNSRWLMYYQLIGVPGAQGSQTTMVATAPKFFSSYPTLNSWTRIGIALDVYGTAAPGDGHTGYFKPFKYRGLICGYSLVSGTSNSRRAFWVSNDGVTFQRDPRNIGFGQNSISHLTGFAADWNLSPIQGQVINYGNKLWMLTTAGPASSGVESTQKRLIALPIGPDFVSFGRAVDITPDIQSWEDQVLGVEAPIGGAISLNGRIFAPYRSNGEHGDFGIMEIV